MSVMSDVHQLPIGHPQDKPMAHEELVEQPWLIYELTALWRSPLLVKHGLAIDGLAVDGTAVDGLAVVGYVVDGMEFDGSAVVGLPVDGSLVGLAVGGEHVAAAQ
jgi:hypothetical protein